MLDSAQGVGRVFAEDGVRAVQIDEIFRARLVAQNPVFRVDDKEVPVQGEDGAKKRIVQSVGRSVGRNRSRFVLLKISQFPKPFFERRSFFCR